MIVKVRKIKAQMHQDLGLITSTNKDNKQIGLVASTKYLHTLALISYENIAIFKFNYIIIVKY